MKKLWACVMLAGTALAGCQDQASGGAAGGAAGGARQHLTIVGSSTVYPFTKAVVESFARANPSFRAPVLESTGTGGGMKLFCGGVGAQFPDVANASRRIKRSEFEQCARNGVRQIAEVQIGIDGLTLIQAKNAPQPLRLTLADVYKALAARPFGQPQTAKTWRDVNPALPATPIQVFGPPTTSGTRDALVELMLEKGCQTDPAMKALKERNEDEYKAICTKVREDGAFIEAGENDNLLVQKVAGNPGAVGVLGYAFLEENQGAVQPVTIDGVAPTYQTIASYRYPGARPLFIYVKGEHAKVIPGLREFMAEYGRAMAQGGYLAQHGLIVSPADVQARALQAAAQLTPITAEGLS